MITLLQIIGEAALIEGNEVRTSELHGLSQRGGSVEVHIRFGKDIYSPMVPCGGADFILGLEEQESLRGIYFTNPETIFMLNKMIIPIPQKEPISEKEILEQLQKVSKNIHIIPADEICQEKLQKSVVSGIYLLSLAVFQKMIPLKPESIEAAIKKLIPEKYLELNLNTLRLAKG